jgi:hypothetical protein
MTLRTARPRPAKDVVLSLALKLVLLALLYLLLFSHPLRPESGDAARQVLGAPAAESVR